MSIRSVMYLLPAFELPDQIKVMQWHGETFELPKGAIRLATNPVCTNQLYQIGNHVLGFQFHPEITPQVLQLFLDNDAEKNIFVWRLCTSG